MTVQFHDPRAAPLAPPEPYRLRAAVDGPLTIGLLANGFPDSVRFLEQVGDALATRLPAAHFRSYDKGDASKLASSAMLDEISADCDAVVAAYGH